MTDENENVEYGLRVSFEDQSHSYVHGFEAGGLWERMKAGTEAEIECPVHTENRVTLQRMATAEGWSLELTPTEFPEWLNMKLVKDRKAPERPNPIGLRVVR